MLIYEFEEFVSSVEVGDKVHYYNKKTHETTEYTVDYIYINTKINNTTYTPYNGVYELFLRDTNFDKVIKLTSEDVIDNEFELFYGERHLY